MSFLLLCMYIFLCFSVWQHMACMGIDSHAKTANANADYKCEKCRPRPLKYNREQAAAIQRKYLATSKEKAARGRKSQSKTPKSAKETVSALLLVIFDNLPINAFLLNGLITQIFRTVSAPTPTSIMKNKGDRLSVQLRRASRKASSLKQKSLVEYAKFWTNCLR